MGERECIAFEGSKRVATGGLRQVAVAVKERLDGCPEAVVLVFDAVTSHPVEIDFRGAVDDVIRRLETGDHAAEPAEQPKRTPGRPKLGVVGREVTLLPRHWEWLNAQPGGASVTLRRLVEEARRAGGAGERRRDARESAYRFMSAIAGNEPGFEEASRALFAGDRAAFASTTASWRCDVREHALALAEASW